MSRDEIHDRYCDIVAVNWALEEFEYFSFKIRYHFYRQIVEHGGPDGLAFTILWNNNFTIEEEVALSGEATASISHPKDDA